MDTKLKRLIIDTVDKSMEELEDIRTYLYENPEVGGEELKASALLTDTMEKHGFDVTREILAIPYSFQAVYDSGREGASIGITCEYDALPTIGHGCGHNVIAAATVGAAIALKEVVKETGGKVILFGTPAEECFVTKAPMADNGVFEQIDVALTVHPNPINLSSGKTTALDAWQVDFFGKSSHAGAAPEQGINALDAAVHFYSLIGFEKQYLKNTNIYGVFVYGGEKCSVIPDYSAVKYLVRAETMKDIKKIRDLFERCAQAACSAVGTTYKIWNNEPGNKNMVSNRALADIFDKFYEELGGGKMPHVDSNGSTDMGDVSQVVPAIHPWISLDCPDLQLHTEEFAEMTMTPAADRAIRIGSAAMAMTGAEVLTEPGLLAEIKEEFRQMIESGNY